jgi:hypothetical protein
VTSPRLRLVAAALFAVLALARLGTVVADRASAQTAGCDQINALIADHPDHLVLGPGTYDNSCSEIRVPGGYNLLGPGNSALVILHRGGDAAEVGQGASIAGMKWVVAGAPNDVTDNVNPCDGCLGVRMLSHSEADHMTLQGSWLGFDIAADHVTITNSASLKNAYGVLFDQGASKGNAYLANDLLTGNAVAGIGVQDGTEADSPTIIHVHMGFEPHCWRAMREEPSQHEYAVTNMMSMGESCEAPRGVGYDFGSRKTSGIWMQPHTSWSGVNGEPIWSSAAPLPVHAPDWGQTVVVGAGGDGANGPLLGPMQVR